MTPTHCWTLGEGMAPLVMTEITTERLLLKLRLMPLSGEVRVLGLFELDLPTLADQGAVTRRDTADGEIFEVKLAQELDGTCVLIGPAGVRMPIARCAVP